MKYNRISLEEFLGDLKSQINPTEEEIENFRAEISKIENDKSSDDSEEYQKNKINQLLRDIYTYDINTKGKIDAVIYEDGQAQVIFEVKALKNKAEFPKSQDSLQSKALSECILYYLREFHTEKNNNIKHIILCNLREFYIIDAKDFHECFAKDKEINKFFKNVDKNQGNDDSTKKFYKEVEDYLPTLDRELSYTYFELTSTSSDIALIYSILSPVFLLKRRSYIDANTLNQAFYDELLYILGLQEKSENGKIIIVPNQVKNSFLSAITQRLSLDANENFEEIFSLLTTWNNRILFLRLLESMLLSFKHIEKPFLDSEAIKDFEMLSILFFDVLAKKEENREGGGQIFLSYSKTSPISTPAFLIKPH